MKILLHIIIRLVRLSVFIGLATHLSCCDSVLPDCPQIPVDSDGGITITGSINIPEMTVLSTRGDMGDTPNADLKLTLLEFDLALDEKQNTVSMNSFITNIYNAELKSSTADNQATFTVKLNPTDKPKVIHLVVADEYVTIDAGLLSMASIIPNLSIRDDKEAYWGKVDFPNGYSEAGNDGKPKPISGLDKMFENVPVIRNFAKVSVTSNLENFRLLGFQLVNVPTMGTIAPWKRSDLSTPDLFAAPAEGQNYYSFVTKDLEYYGMLPTGVTFRNTESEARSWTYSNMLSPEESCYLYEHPYEEARRTYAIIFGQFKYPDTETENDRWSRPGFYKVDIGESFTKKVHTEDGTDVDVLDFEPYNIIRDINYNIVIEEVKAAGTQTVAQAIARAPFNNIIAATELATLPSMSDGINLLMVNDINHVIVNENEKIDFLYRYVPNIYLGGQQPEDNSIPRVVGLVPGNVIASVGPRMEFTDGSGAKWIKYEITCKKPTDVTQIQEFSVVDRNGLGRTVHLILHEPWPYEPIKNTGGEEIFATVAAGKEDSYQGPPQTISSEAGQELTVYFNLPDGLPKSMFPLEFRLESKNQGIENNKIGTLVVSYGLSLFPGKENEITISYIKTLSYDEYLYNYKQDDNSNDIDPGSPNENHTVRCRFLTITAVNDTDAEIMIHSPYFSPNASVSFKRK